MRILAVTDLNKVGSGYTSLSLPIMMELRKLGHEIKVIGLSNDGKQHSFDFSIIPARTMPEVLAMIQNFWTLWTFDVLIVLLDINIQSALMEKMSTRPFKYIGVFPIESDPLSYSWAMTLLQMDKQFVISRFGTEEAHKKGVMTAEFLPVGIDTKSWRPPTSLEKAEVRKAMGIGEETKVVLTVADNQERKNLPASFMAFKHFSNLYPDSKHILVTREQLYAGWNIQELADTIGISEKLMVFERGMSFKKLWTLYAAADVFLLLSKTEGLGLPVMEAMAMKVPVVGTDCSGIRELLSDGRGWLVDYIVGDGLPYIDPFGNGHRYLAHPSKAGNSITFAINGDERVDAAYEFIKTRTWEKAVEPIQNYLKGIENEAKQKAEPISEADPDQA